MKTKSKLLVVIFAIIFLLIYIFDLKSAFSYEKLHCKNLDGVSQKRVDNSNQTKDIDWSKNKALKLKKIILEPVKIFYPGKDLLKGGLQGYTVTDKYIVFSQVTADMNDTIINILDKDSFRFLGCDSRYSFGHANDMAFNSRTGEIIVVTAHDNMIAKFKIKSDFTLSDVSYVNCNRTYYGIAYDKEDDYYIAYSSGKMYVLDNTFREKYSFNLIKGLIPQGLTYFNGYIYYGCYENGNPKRKVYNSKEKGSSLIYQYDMQGVLQQTLYIPSVAEEKDKRELESICFQKDGILLIGCSVIKNRKVSISFYKSNIN